MALVVAKRGKGNALGTPAAEAMEQRVMAFAEELGRIAGTFQSKGPNDPNDPNDPNGPSDLICSLPAKHLGRDRGEHHEHQGQHRPVRGVGHPPLAVPDAPQ